MTRNEVIAAATRAGYTLIQTAAGAIPLSQWTPYGATHDDPRMFTRIVLGWDFLQDPPHGPRIVDRVPPGEIGGSWPVGPRNPADSQPEKGAAQ